MVNQNILICGASSFVSSGIVERLKREGCTVDCFSRGVLSRQENVIRGDYKEISNNNFLDKEYDVVINYAIIKDGTIEDNLQYIKSLVQLCTDKRVKKLIHFSSVMVYSHHVGYINEETPMETVEETWMEGYGKIKIAVDEYLLSVKDLLPFEIVLVRPGYVLAGSRPCPFIKPLPMQFALIKGYRGSKQPIVKREEIHEAIFKIIQTANNFPVYLLFPNDGMTKYSFAKQQGYKHLIGMPRLMFKHLPFLMMKIGLMSKAMYSRFEGMYNENIFDSAKTQHKLQINFT